MPRLSGLAILAGVEVAGWIWLPGDGQSHAILLGAIAIAAVGVVDDVRGLPALPKLLGQVGAALIPVLAGVRVDNLTLPFIGGFELGWLAYPLTVLGIVAVVNVINFLDGVDGLAAGVCTIAALTLAAIALSLERNAAGVLAALTAGAALGFLRHGFPPASSFMGDTGSNLLGYLPCRSWTPASSSPSGSNTGSRSTRPTAGTSTTAWPTSASPSAARSPISTPGRWSWRPWPWPCASFPTATTTGISMPSGRW
jgi:hypothetical protein